jgi:hypothetical protein
MYSGCTILTYELARVNSNAITGSQTIHEKVTIQSLCRMYPELCRSLPFLDNSDQHYIVPALKRCVELLVNLCRSIVTYLYIAQGPAITCKCITPKLRPVCTLILYTPLYVKDALVSLPIIITTLKWIIRLLPIYIITIWFLSNLTKNFNCTYNKITWLYQ